MAVPDCNDAFKRLYPEQHYDTHVDSGIRPDGRVLGLARETTIGLRPIESADSSALVKIGQTTVMAGVKLEIMKPSDEAPEEGMLAIQLELTPMCSPEARPGRVPEKAHVLSQQLEAHLAGGKSVDPTQLCIHKASAAWALYCDVYVLNDDGSLGDACLLAAVSALASLHLPSVSISKDGQVLQQDNSEDQSDVGSIVAAKPLPLNSIPLSLTCGMRNGLVLADPTLAEEDLMETLVTTVLDQDGFIIGLHKAGGIPVPDSILQDCVETTRLRYQTLAGLLAQELKSNAA